MSFINYSEFQHLFTNGIRVTIKEPKCPKHNFKLADGICLECEREKRGEKFICKECKTKHAPLHPVFEDDKKIKVKHYLCTDCKEEKELCTGNCHL